MPDCAICLSRSGYDCEVSSVSGKDACSFKCPVCGEFEVSRNALMESFIPQNSRFTPMKRAILSHKNRINYNAGIRREMYMTYDIEDFLNSDESLPNPAQQAMNAIRFIGEKVLENFEPLRELPPEFHAVIGSPSRSFAEKIVSQLVQSDHLSGMSVKTMDNPYEMMMLDLNLLGWESFEEERVGKFQSGSGFLALKFGDEVLDPFINDVVKPKLAAMGFKVSDLREFPALVSLIIDSGPKYETLHLWLWI